MAGTVGAIFNAALNMGSAIGIAAVDSVETSVDKQNPGATGALAYKGCTGGFYLLLGIVCLEILSVSVFYRNKREASDVDGDEDDNESGDEEKKVGVVDGGCDVMQEKGGSAVVDFDRKSIQVTEEPIDLDKKDIEEV